MERKHTPVYGIKGKLISAVCMLLVAVIMVVSSTYAWFTLSTAPEVTGISTAIGANGALEIWLNRSDENDDINATPGNLVDLGDGIYGLSSIKLLPSTAIFGTDGENTTLGSGLLSYATYGPDGRPTIDTATNTAVTGTFDKDNFYENDVTGVRAVGKASGMTDRQLAYRNAVEAVNSAMTRAKNEAKKSLTNRGNTLGNIVIKKDTDDNATFTSEEVTAIQGIINDLLGTDPDTVDGVLDYIEDAYLKQIIALAASQKANDLAGEGNEAIGDLIYSTVKEQVENKQITLAGIGTSGNVEITVDADNNPATDNSTTYTFPISGALLDGIRAYNATRTKVASATIPPTGSGATGEYLWSDISGALACLIDIEKVTVNEKTATEIKEDINGFVNSFISGGQGVIISMPSTAGVYADIADHCENYSANVELKNVKYGGFTLEKLPVSMQTASNQNPAYLKAAMAIATVAGKPASGEGSQKLPLSDFYGYIIDLGFKTNAASSNLLLQVDGVDRIYEDNTNEETMGGGSYMTFDSTSVDFSTDQVKELMKAIRIVFFEPTMRVVLGYAKLDVEHAEVGADGVKAKMYMYEIMPAMSLTYTKTAGDAEKTTEIYEVVKKDRHG